MTIMEKVTDDHDPSHAETPAPKLAWIRPKLEVAAGRDAEGSFSRSGGADYGTYS
jgi:hypothetical protein